MPGELREKCAVVGISGSPETDAALMACYGLEALQHRGEDSSGIASMDYGGKFHAYVNKGLAKDVFSEATLAPLAGQIAIGHNRYKTVGSVYEHLQPVTDAPIAFALGHNGTLPITSELEKFVEQAGGKAGAMNDSEMIAFAVAQQIRGGKELPDAVEAVYPLLTGAFSCVVLRGNTLVAFRDPWGIRPLSIGETEDGFIIASETCAIETVDAKVARDVQPGEIVIIEDGKLESRQVAEPNLKLDIFEDVYFARPDSQLHGQSVGLTRYQMGVELAKEHPLPADVGSGEVVVVGVPESAIPVAEGYADALGVRHRNAIIKNRYRGNRSFIQNDQSERLSVLRKKFNALPEAVAGRHVILVEDSIVRGNTAPRFVPQLMAAGAESVSMVVGSPPIRFPDFYGVDTPEQKELIAANLTIEEMRQSFGFKYLGFLSLAGLIRATGQPGNTFNLSAFIGEYPIDIGEHKHKIFTPPTT